MLHYYPNDDRKRPVEQLPLSDRTTIDVGKNLLLFDGRRGHEVTPFEGERFSLVWFTAPRVQKALPEAKDVLRKRLFSFPKPVDTAKAMKLLKGPGGYGGSTKSNPVGKCRM